ADRLPGGPGARRVRYVQPGLVHRGGAVRPGGPDGPGHPRAAGRGAGGGAHGLNCPKAPRWKRSGPAAAARGSVPRASTRPTTIRWSPPVCTAWIVQSIHAGTSARRGEPVAGAGTWRTPANLSAPLTAKARHSAPWPAPRTLTQNTPARAIRGQVVDVRATMNATSGGSRDREVKDWQ